MEKETKYTGQEKEIILAIIDLEIAKLRMESKQVSKEIKFWEELRAKFYGA
jgi:hypothetical protein